MVVVTLRAELLTFLSLVTSFAKTQIITPLRHILMQWGQTENQLWARELFITENLQVCLKTNLIICRCLSLHLY